MRWMFVVALAALCGGCATVTRGMNDQVQIESEPPGADIRTSMGQTCVTPCTLQFGRKDQFTVTASKPGYHTSEMPVQTRVAGAGVAGFAGNVLIGGVIGMGVDAASGAMLEHYPNPVMMKMVPLRKGEAPRLLKQEPPPPPPPPPTPASDAGPPQS
jgi:PEGA domain-containing protein